MDAEFWKALIVSLLGYTGIIGIATKWLISSVKGKIKATEEKQKALERGVQALLRDRLIYQYEKYSARGNAPIYAKENFENIYAQYHNLGANGVMDKIHEEFKNLPTGGD